MFRQLSLFYCHAEENLKTSRLLKCHQRFNVFLMDFANSWCGFRLNLIYCKQWITYYLYKIHSSYHLPCSVIFEVKPRAVCHIHYCSSECWKNPCNVIFLTSLPPQPLPTPPCPPGEAHHSLKTSGRQHEKDWGLVLVCLWDDFDCACWSLKWGSIRFLWTWFICAGKQKQRLYK